MAPVPELTTTYVLLRAGAVMLRVVAPLLAVHKMMACRDWLAAKSVSDSTTSSSKLSVVVPATAESIRSVICSLRFVPHVPSHSP